MMHSPLHANLTPDVTRYGMLLDVDIYWYMYIFVKQMKSNNLAR